MRVKVVLVVALLVAVGLAALVTGPEDEKPGADVDTGARVADLCRTIDDWLTAYAAKKDESTTSDLFIAALDDASQLVADVPASDDARTLKSFLLDAQQDQIGKAENPLRLRREIDDVDALCDLTALGDGDGGTATV